MTGKPSYRAKIYVAIGKIACAAKKFHLIRPAKS